MSQLAALPPTEIERLSSLEAVVDKGMQTFIEVGNALREIRDERLYRASHSSFESYCRERWDMGRSYGNRLIAAANVVDVIAPLAPTGASSDEGLTHPDWREGFRREYASASATPADGARPASASEERAAARALARDVPPPTSERVVRGLAATAKTDPDRAAWIWREAVAIHGPDATAEQVAVIAEGAVNGATSAEAEWQRDMRSLAGDLRRVAKRGNPKDARRALARWRGVYAHLDRIAKS